MERTVNTRVDSVRTARVTPSRDCDCITFLLSIAACDEGEYGENCKYTCGFCQNGTCDAITGLCHGDCQDGYLGDKCDKGRCYAMLLGLGIALLVGKCICSAK